MQAENGVAVQDIYINQGDDFYMTIAISLGEEPFVLDNQTFKFAGRYSLRDKSLAFVGEVTQLSKNIIQLYIPSEITAKLRANTEYGTYQKIYYDVQMIENNDEVRILQGIAYVSAGNAYKAEV
ncbi:hypothetical protein H6A02_01840 [Veillonella magna]|uniref:hypothetical protein n=1 Tax=Veillonella magna TaxID=464322 RepID=UPI0019603A1A|nr:hypothetical protein [Veillonella magna]MBM6823728.1 hypothetical protein [Veillonella magna]